MKVLFVDDHLLFNEGVSAIIKNASPGNQVDTALNGKKALEFLAVEDTNYDVILVDLTMPEMDGIAFLCALAERRELTPAVVLSATEDLPSIARAMELGAFGFIPKSHTADELLKAIETVLEGDIYLPEPIRRRLDKLDIRELERKENIEKVGLTRRQMEVLTLLGEGYSNREIADALFLSQHTVKFHVAALLEILEASNRTDCVARALSQGLIVHD